MWISASSYFGLLRAFACFLTIKDLCTKHSQLFKSTSFLLSISVSHPPPPLWLSIELPTILSLSNAFIFPFLCNYINFHFHFLMHSLFLSIAIIFTCTLQTENWWGRSDFLRPQSLLSAFTGERTNINVPNHLFKWFDNWVFSNCIHIQVLSTVRER